MRSLRSTSATCQVPGQPGSQESLAQTYDTKAKPQSPGRLIQVEMNLSGLQGSAGLQGLRRLGGREALTQVSSCGDRSVSGCL